MKASPPDRQPLTDRANHADRRVERQLRERRSGEGSESALASLKSMELDRQKSQPPEDEGIAD